MYRAGFAATQEAYETHYKLVGATLIAIVDFDGDGTFNVWEIDQDNKLIETIKD